MKSMIVKELKRMGIRKIEGKKVESYRFYDLCGYLKAIKNGIEVK